MARSVSFSSRLLMFMDIAYGCSAQSHLLSVLHVSGELDMYDTLLLYANSIPR